MSETAKPNSNFRQLVVSDISCPVNYNACDDIQLITCYFNPTDYQTKLLNFKIFENIIRKSKINLLVVECVFGNAAFTLNDLPNVLQIRSPHILWQKERLINIAITKLPAHIKKAVWIDCDVLFSNPNWLVETSKLLETYPVVQTFEIAIRLPQGHMSYKGEGEIWESFGYINNRDPEKVFEGNFHSHGHTGFAWAARVDLLQKHGLYDTCISGSGDHFMAHAMCGDFNNPCLERMIDGKFKSHFMTWGQSFYRDVQCKIGFVPGTLLHLWHGSTEDRQYLQRHSELLERDFDPANDICIGNNGTWVWNSHKPSLHRWALDYFQLRKEDGNE